LDIGCVSSLYCSRSSFRSDSTKFRIEALLRTGRSLLDSGFPQSAEFTCQRQIFSLHQLPRPILFCSFFFQPFQRPRIRTAAGKAQAEIDVQPNNDLRKRYVEQPHYEINDGAAGVASEAVKPSTWFRIDPQAWRSVASMKRAVNESGPPGVEAVATGDLIHGKYPLNCLGYIAHS
jgi:hypothetical protein